MTAQRPATREFRDTIHGYAIASRNATIANEHAIANEYSLTPIEDEDIMACTGLTLARVP